MTPARFDLLYLLRRVAIIDPEASPFAGRLQTSLVKELGLHRSTVSKMLKRLQQMGWIRRRRSELDRRTFDVSLTPEGLRRIWRAMRRVFRRKMVKKQYERLFRPKRPEDAQPWDEFLKLYGGAEIAAQEAWRPPTRWAQPGEHLVDVIHDVYLTIRCIARWFGDESRVWYDLGRGLPSVCP